MICKDCLQNCDRITSDQCVQYTGPAIPLLGICQGDQLAQWENDIVVALLSALDGTGITPANVTLANCTWLSTQLGVLAPSLNNLLQLLINGECSLYNMIVAIQNQIAAGQNGTVIDILCLTVPANPTTADIIQAIINLLCSINTIVAALPTTYVALSDLNNLVIQIINNQSGGGGGVVVQYNTRLVPFVAVEYYGPLANFDNAGKGLAANGFDKIYICNGSNGTPDHRGRVGVGAIRNVPGGSLDPAVDPVTDPNNPNWGLGDKLGACTVTLTTPQTPTHTHNVADPGHTHTITATGIAKSGTTTSPVWVVDAGADPPKGTNTFTNKLSTATTGITIGATGGGQPHSNIQPTIAANFIMYIP